MSGPLFKARHKARYYALQALYGWVLTQNNLSDIEQFYLADKNVNKIDLVYFYDLVRSVPGKLEELDALLLPYLSRNLTDIDIISLVVLRIATYEFAYKLEVPYKVIINEALELCKKFGATDSHKFVNGVLDKLAAQLRSNETTPS